MKAAAALFHPMHTRTTTALRDASAHFNDLARMTTAATHPRTTRAWSSSRATTSTSARHSTRRTVVRATSSTSSSFAFQSMVAHVFSGPTAKRARAKEALLDAISRVNRGTTASEEDKIAIDALARALEKLNPTRASLSSSALSGEWELKYTTSASILGMTKPALFRPRGPIYQTIDSAALKARNRETAPFYNAVEADLTPTSKSAVNVQFKKFFVLGGLIKITAPERARGALDITYVDDDVRVSRGDKGNLFVLTMSDPNARLA
jgi:hypothetical protein